MVYAKRYKIVQERSLLIFLLPLILLFMLIVPFTAQGQSTPAQLKLTPEFLNGRVLSQAQQPERMLAAGEPLQNPAAPVYNVIALRVEFQPDTTRFTTGNGIFDSALFDTLEANVDPLPHDAAYFDAHLQFLANYVQKSSDGATQLNTFVIPEIVRVSQPMAAYSPTGLAANSEGELAKLARLVEEAWTLADQQSSFDMSGFDPANTALILFHAGVGRDIELIGTSLDKTPQDLPTIFFSEEALATLLPGSQVSFNGFPVNHTIMMPRTETRVGFDFIQDQAFLVEFSINGLLAASFFNFLGVPDLFDTATGESAIGPFGLMDPLGLFAFNGLFPPEPTAWTKQYLGWTQPLTISGPDPNITLLDAASSNAGLEAARVPISESEYFLVENRYRDLAGDGLTLTIYRDGQMVQQRIENGDEEFNSVNIDGFEGGVVVDVDDYDWALPGGVDADDNALNGGILIWHIDERIIAERLPANQVNIDPVRRGVDLEEADGAQDIGFPTDNIFGPQAFLGTPFDFFYEGNPVVVINTAGEEIALYQNRFAADTYPNSNSNANGPSFVVLDAFSLPGSTMTFAYSRQTAAGVAPLDGFPFPESGSSQPGSFLTSFSDPEAGLIYQNDRGEVVISTRFETAPMVLSNTVQRSPVVIPGNRVAMLSANADGTSLHVVENGEVTTVPVSDFYASGQFSHLAYDNLNNRLVAYLERLGENLVVDISLNPTTLYQVSEILRTTEPIYSFAITPGGEIALLGPAGVTFGCCESKWTYAMSENGRAGQLVLGEDESGQVGAFVDVSGDKLIFLQADGTTTIVDLTQFRIPNVDYTLSWYPVLVDLNKDNRLDVLISYGPSLLAFHAGGGLADGFPIRMPASMTVQPLVASFRDVEERVVLAGLANGYLYAYQLTDEGQQVPGFPLAVGEGIATTPLIDGGRLFGVDVNGAVQAWEIAGMLDPLWGQQYGNAYHTSYVKLEPVPGESASQNGGGTALLPSDETYNWPNPIRQGETFFRLTPAQDARVTITIIDTAGGLVDEITVENVRGGTATDVLWQTDAPSGLYIARVEARSADGASETKLIKMAIVR